MEDALFCSRDRDDPLLILRLERLKFLSVAGVFVEGQVNQQASKHGCFGLEHSCRLDL